MNKIVYLSFAVLALGSAQPGRAQQTAVDRLMAYIEVDTVNPPGNETRGVEFFGKILAAAGIPYETAESAPGRGNLWARLEGGDEPGLILLNHMDVVPATADAWDTDPLKAVVIDGMLHGRGVLDMKSIGIAQLEAFLALHRSGRRLSRDVIFVATADEEAGGEAGAGWLVKHRPEVFDGAGFLLTEGGGVTSIDGRTLIQIGVAEKRPYWLRLTATDEPGHGSAPRPTSATTRLIAALQRIQSMPFEPRITDQVRSMLVGYSRFVPRSYQQPFGNIDEAIKDPEFLARFQRDLPRLHALVRNTCSITVLSGSNKINVVPPTATAELDCRILPDQDAEQFLRGIEARIADEHIRVEPILLFEESSSSTDTGLYQLLVNVSRQSFPGAPIVAGLSAGFTDSHFFRDIGIDSYGYAPFVLSQELVETVHGNNERIGLDAFNRGVDLMVEIMDSFTR